MTILVSPADPFDATVTNAPTGLEGQIGFQVILLADQSVAIDHRTTGIVEGPTGIYTTSDISPVVPGQYLIVWDYGGVTATEDLTVSASVGSFAPPTDGYASVTDVRDYAPELVTFSDDEITVEIRKAEKDVDWYAGYSGAIDETTGLRFVPLSEQELRYAVAINRATCAQVQYRFYMGKAFTVDEMQYEEIQGRDQTVRKAQRMGPAARSEFPAGLRKLTGRFA